MIGKVYIVGAGPGDPALITLKAVQTLRGADVVLYDRLVNTELLDHALSAFRVYVGKRSNSTPFDEQRRIERMMVAYARRGLLVVRLKGGDPFVFGRGGEEVLALRKARIEYEVIPGVSASYAAPASAGIPLTLRGSASSFAVFSAHAAFDGSGAGVDWELAVRIPTAVFLMGARRVHVIVEKLLQYGPVTGDSRCSRGECHYERAKSFPGLPRQYPETS